MMGMVEILGLLATFSIMLSAVPQIVKIIKVRNVVGVSVAMWYITITLNVSLFSYGLLSGYLSMVAGGLVNSVMALILATIITFYKRKVFVAVPFFYLIGLVVLVFATQGVLGGEYLSGIYLTLIGATICLNALPQVFKSWKSLRTRTRTNIALGTFVLLICGQILWTAYSVFQNDTVLIYINLFSVFATGSIILFEFLNKQPGRVVMPRV